HTMTLTNCPACGHAISADTEECPECGVPNRPLQRTPRAPTCYKCSAVATTKCPKCGEMSCAEHLRSGYAGRGEGGANELCCDECNFQARIYVLVGIGSVIVVALMFVLAYFLRH